MIVLPSLVYPYFEFDIEQELLTQAKALFVCSLDMATFLQLRVNNPPCPGKRMQINLNKIEQCWDTNKQSGEGGGGWLGGSN